MVAAILQLQSVGSQDLYLTSQPTINVFKYKYHQYVNFATELVRLTLDDVLDFGKTSSCTIPKRGHLLSNLYLRVKVPRLVKTSGTYLSWTETLGYAIFREGVDLEIGGVVVDTFYPGFWDIFDSFNTPDNDLGSNLLILRGDTYISTKFNAEKANDLVIPLKFWFTRDYSLSLPIVSMPSQDIRVKFKFREFQDCINYDGIAPSDENVVFSEVLAEYVYLDDIILDEFRAQTHTFLIEQVRYNGTEFIRANTGIHNTQLEFHNPCKELLFACSTESNVTLNNNYFNYSDTEGDSLVSEIGLFLDGRARFDYMPEVVNRLMYAKLLHSNVPLKYVYTVPFCIRPQVNQPTGTLNMSRFDNTTLSLKMAAGNPACFVYIYAVMYNVIVIENGFLSIKFTL